MGARVPVFRGVVRDGRPIVIAGIDYSTRFVDVVLLDEDSDAAEWHRFPLYGADAFDRARNVYEATFGWSLLWQDAVAIGIEQPQARGPRAANIGALYRIQGAILSRLPSATLVHPIYPSVWRKTVGLSGNASKADVMHFGCGRMGHVDYQHENVFPDPHWPQDAYDAYCIALATRSLIQVTA